MNFPDTNLYPHCHTLSPKFQSEFFLDFASKNTAILPHLGRYLCERLNTPPPLQENGLVFFPLFDDILEGKLAQL